MGEITDYLICPRCDSGCIEWLKEKGDCLYLCECGECGCEFLVEEYTSYSIEEITKEPKEKEE